MTAGCWSNLGAEFDHAEQRDDTGELVEIADSVLMLARQLSMTSRAASYR
jgi:hypothetical protein